MASFDRVYKIFTLGDAAVGKTCLLLRYSENTFQDEHLLTLGMDYKKKVVTRGNKKIKIQLWDTAGQERYRSITKQMYKNANCILLIYDVTESETFKGISNWANQIETNIGTSVVKVLVGNKCDDDKNRKVSYEQGKKMADELKMGFFETSAKQNIKVKELFDFAIDEILKKFDVQESPGSVVIIGGETKKEGCCKGKNKQPKKAK